MSQPLRLSDAELDAVFAACRPLDPDLRDPFLQAVAHALQDCNGEIGPGMVARVCRDMQQQFFNPPDLGHGRLALGRSCLPAHGGAETQRVWSATYRGPSARCRYP
jgi:hypothetical protein